MFLMFTMFHTETKDHETGLFKVEYEFLRPSTRKESYVCDITYGTNNEFGFDYLRDNLVSNKEALGYSAGITMRWWTK